MRGVTVINSRWKYQNYPGRANFYDLMWNNSKWIMKPEQFALSVLNWSSNGIKLLHFQKNWGLVIEDESSCQYIVREYDVGFANPTN